MMKTVKNSLRYGKHLRSCTANRMRVAPLSMVEGLKQFQSSAAVDQDMATRLQGFDKPTVWGEFAPLAKELDAINLGQGAPEWETPSFVQNHAKDALTENYNQYTRSGGHPSLVKALAHQYSQQLDRDIDPLTEIAVTVGVSEGLFAAMQAFVNPGDEVIIMEPAFDIYPAQAQMAGATVRRVPMRPSPEAERNPDKMGLAAHAFTVDMEEMEQAINDKTKVILLNTPHNPTGKVFTESELESFAELLERHPQVVAFVDEVYESMTYQRHELDLPDDFNLPSPVLSYHAEQEKHHHNDKDHLPKASEDGGQYQWADKDSIQHDFVRSIGLTGADYNAAGKSSGVNAPTSNGVMTTAVPVQHTRLASLPGMWNRVLTFSSAGKTFSCTGWKIGWVYGSSELVSKVQMANQWIPFCVATPLQEAIARSLASALKPYDDYPNFYGWLRAEYVRKRQLLVDALLAAGIKPTVSDGSFFIMGNTENLEVPQKYLDQSSEAVGGSGLPRDWAFARWLAYEAGIVCIPPSAFYRQENKHLAANFGRFAFCKTDESLREAKVRFEKFAEMNTRKQ